MATPYLLPCKQGSRIILSPRYGIQDLNPRKSVSADGKVIRSEKIGKQ